MTENEVSVTVTALKAGERTESLIASLERELGVDLEEAGEGRWRVQVPNTSSEEAAVEAVIAAIEGHDDGDDWGEHLEVHAATDADVG
jgi:hypothetical protein